MKRHFEMQVEGKSRFGVGIIEDGGEIMSPR